ncbi:MAG: hypothetical protein WKF84_08365 [Pyrinomonadaceae bacterium]
MPEKAVTIKGGSLSIDFQRNNFSKISKDGDEDRHTDPSVRIKRVEIKDDNVYGSKPVEYQAPANGKCTVTIIYEEP